MSEAQRKQPRSPKGAVVEGELPSLLSSTWPAGLIAGGVGLFLILLSMGIIEPQSVSRRKTIFDGPNHWQIMAIGLMFIIVGALFTIPKRAQALGRFAAMLFIIVTLVAGAGTTWYSNGGSHRQKGGSMDAFLDAIAAWFQSYGLHPVLGAFISGVVIAFVFAYRRSATDDAPPAATPKPSRFRSGESTSVVAKRTTSISMTVNDRPADVPDEVLEHIRAGKKVEAIKVLRNASGLGLKESKDLVDLLADNLKVPN